MEVHELVGTRLVKVHEKYQAGKEILSLTFERVSGDRLVLSVDAERGSDLNVRVRKSKSKGPDRAPIDEARLEEIQLQLARLDETLDDIGEDSFGEDLGELALSVHWLLGQVDSLRERLVEVKGGMT